MKFERNSILNAVVLIFLMLPWNLSGQRETMTIFLAVPKPVVQQGEVMWYGLALDRFLLKNSNYPVVHGYLSDHSGDVIEHWAIHPDSSFFIGMIPVRESAIPGSYVLSVAIWDESYSRVLEESDQVVHILGKEDQIYYRFKAQTGTLQPESSSSGGESSPRQSICIQRKPNRDLAYVALKEWEVWRSRASFRAPDLSTRYGYELGVQLDSTIAGEWTVYDTQNMTSKSVNLVETGGVLTMDDFAGAKELQLVGLLDNQLLQVKPPVMPALLWKPSDLEQLVLPSAQINELQDREEKRTLIGNIFNYQYPLATPGSQNQAISRFDDEYDLSKFLPFESIELFIHEVVLPLKLLRKRNLHSIRVLNKDTKNWFEEAPVLMVNGIIQSSISPLFEIPYDQCISIRLYRSLETTRQRFGPLARNGVIEILTKPSYQTSENTLKVEGLMPASPYSLSLPAGRDADTPILTPVPLFGIARSNPVCYTHNDETGEFRYMEFRLENRHLVEAFNDFKVE